MVWCFFLVLNATDIHPACSVLMLFSVLDFKACSLSWHCLKSVLRFIRGEVKLTGDIRPQREGWLIPVADSQDCPTY